jgi:tryptophan synthase alpha chain
MNLTNPRLIGFGIADYKSFSTACKYSNGAIIGSAFIRAIEESNDLEAPIIDFIGMIKNEKIEI